MISKIDRSKTAPSEQFFPITEGEGSDDRYSTYNYYIYYHSIKPRDPRLPLPTYKPEPDLAFLRDKALNEDKNIDDHKDFEHHININSGDNSYEKSDDINSMMTSLNVRENTNLPSIGGSGLLNKNNYFQDTLSQNQYFDNDNSTLFSNNNLGFNNNITSGSSIPKSGYNNNTYQSGFQQGGNNNNNFDYYRNNNNNTGNIQEFSENNFGNQFGGNKGGHNIKQQQLYQQQPLQDFGNTNERMFYQQSQPQNTREFGYSGGIQNKMNSQYNQSLKQGMNQNNPYYMMNQQQPQGQYGNYNQGYMQNNMNRNYNK